MATTYIILLILAVVSFAVSRLLFALVNDPEGPNLLIVTVLALVIFVPLSLAYRRISKKPKR